MRLVAVDGVTAVVSGFLTAVASAKVVSRTLVASALAITSAFAQQPPTGGAVTVRGVVTTANDVPLPRVRVAVAGDMLLRIQSPSPMPELESAVLTDARGQFTINVPAAQPRITFTKAGYIPSTAELPRDSTAAADLRVRLSRGGAISGVVVDRTGIRMMLATVTAHRLDASPATGQLSTTTNDIGEFRFGGLDEGAYSLAAAPSTFALTGPITEREKLVSAATVQGPTVTVSVGTEVANINLTIEMPSDMASRVDTRPAEPTPEAAGSLSGRVTADGLPVARAVVMVRRNTFVPRLAETDERGRYVIDRLAAGEYTVEVQKYGFVNRQYGQTGDASIGRSVTVRSGEAVASIDVMLARGGAIAGTIFDEFGEPLQGVEVRALQVQAIAGRRRALRVSTLGSYRTDDRGQYRLFPLQPGTYVVQAMVRDRVAGEGGYAPVYYPGALSVDQAIPTKVGFNAAATAIDLTLTPGNTRSVAGRVLDASGTPTRAQVLLAVSERSGATSIEPVTAMPNPDGWFSFANVAPGDYVVQANGIMPARDRFGAPVTGARSFATSFVSVGGDDPPPVELRLSPGATLSGRVIYEGLAEVPPRAMSMIAFPTNFDRGPMIGAGPMGFALRPDNMFEYKGVFGPTLLRVEPGQSDWYVKSIMFKGQDLSDTPFDFGLDGTFSEIDVVISTLGAGLTGRVTDERATSVSDYSVLIFSTFRDRWFTGSRWVKTGRSDQDGTFRIQGLPPGDYWVAAIERVTNAPGVGAITPEADLLESLSARALRITLGEGQTRDMTLRLIRR